MNGSVAELVEEPAGVGGAGRGEARIEGQRPAELLVRTAGVAHGGRDGAGVVVQERVGGAKPEGLTARLPGAREIAAAEARPGKEVGRLDGLTLPVGALG